MILENYIHSNKEKFIQKVEQISLLLEIEPEWLMIVMYAESGLNPQAVNKYGGATGLIQFMPNTARVLGTSVSKLAKMDNVTQLDYVYKYYQFYRGRIHSVYDLYLITFFPIALGKPDNWVMKTSRLSAWIIAKQNPAIDINHNGQITVGEFKRYVDKILQRKNITLKKKA